MKFQPVKCNMMQLNRDRATKLHLIELADLSDRKLRRQIFSRRDSTISYLMYEAQNSTHNNNFMIEALKIEDLEHTQRPFKLCQYDTHNPQC